MEIIDFKKHKKSRISFGIKLSGSEWESYLTKASAKLQEGKPVAGFRAGKAPLGAAYGMYGKRLVMAAADSAGMELVDRACAKKSIAPVSVPQITVVEANMDRFECIVSLYSYPEIENLQYRGLEAEWPKRVVTDADIDREAEHYMRNHLNVHEVEREARMGDIAEVSFTGTTGGHGFPFDHSSKSRFILGSGQLFAGLDEALTGHKKGDTLNLSLTMPKNFHRDVIAGLTLDLEVYLKGVWARDRYELNDDFVREKVMGCNSVQEFREYLRGELEDRYGRTSEKLFTENLQKALADAVAPQVPDAMVDTAAERIERGLHAAAKSQGRTIEELLQDEGKTLDEFRKEARPDARLQTMLSVAIDYIVTKENLSVTDQELNEFYSSYASGMEKKPEEIRTLFGGDEGAVDEILNRKAMAIVRSAAKPVIVETESFPGEDKEQPRLFGR